MRFQHRKFESVVIICFLIISFAASSPSSISPPPTPDLQSQLEETSNGTIIQKRQMSAGSSCEGSEGQWNCLTNQWQRCASGQWSVVMDCAAGTICTPSGLTYDFFVQFANGAAGGPTTSGSAPRPGAEAARWLLPMVLGGLAVTLGPLAR
ncbi:hypothetical protein F4677DRAFT_439493 [Hypoxylon crocopeplum]|nr:hypothetical protein F4677DRAFT_439493 [Hypoxylon crocopeplum]